MSVGENARNFETLGKLLRHERFLIANCNDAAIRNSPDSVYMLVGNLPATDYCDTKHFDERLALAVCPELRKECFHRLLHRHTWLPTQSCFEFLVRVALTLPISRATATIEGRRKLALRPFRVFFPRTARAISNPVGNANRPKAPSHFVSFEKLASSEEVIINNIKDFTVDSRRETSEDNCFGTIIDIGQWQKIRAAYLDKRSENLDPDAAV